MAELIAHHWLIVIILLLIALPLIWDTILFIYAAIATILAIGVVGMWIMARFLWRYFARRVDWDKHE
jgi:hypothetical protein